MHLILYKQLAAVFSETAVYIGSTLLSKCDYSEGDLAK